MKLGLGQTLLHSKLIQQSIPKADMLELSASFGSNINAGSPVDGDPVYFMGDTSGGGNDYSQGTLLNQPIYRDSGFGANNMPYIEFDGINDFLLDANPYNYALPYTAFMVSKMGTNVAGASLNLGSLHWIQTNPSTTRIGIIHGSGDADYAFTSDTLNNHLLDWVEEVGTSHAFNLNGALLMNTNPNPGNPNFGGNKLIGRRSGGAYKDFQLAEIRMFDGILTASQIQAVRNDLNNKYAIYS